MPDEEKKNEPVTVHISATLRGTSEDGTQKEQRTREEQSDGEE